MSAPGIYVEIEIQAPLDRIWQLSQNPALHQRWDLRFTRIEYLPKTTDTQHFLYETRIGFGLAIRGTGESIATRADAEGNTVSSLKFASEDQKSLIRTGGGYWRYLPSPHGTTFLTWYDYQVRFGLIGKAADLIFRPLMGWATAWSFDRLRLWAENDQPPEQSLAFAAIHAAARFAIAFVWLWHGLVPKLLAHHIDERTMLQQSGLPLSALPYIGAGEIALALVTLLSWQRRSFFLFNGAAMLIALAAVALRSPAYLVAAFNPITLNLGVVALSLAGWIAATYAPFAGRCRRKPKETAS